MPIPSDDILIFTQGLANTPQLRQAAKDWAKRNKEMPAKYGVKTPKKQKS
jgi:hypothetical protein